ncbi:MAG: RNA-directed DNA polymerase [Lachnospiraceae bacterium]|nr:RNA-directed DNA polymerase [Lachnospiraceae bacterium]
MTSEERRNARYLRRKAKRQARKNEILEQHQFYHVYGRNALAKAAKDATKNVRYKASVKRYMQRRLVNISILSENLIRRKDVRKGFICFSLFERGKLRKIMSVHFAERIPQKSLNQNALSPVLTKSLIYDNGASQAGKGTNFAIERITIHLRRHYRLHGLEGYVLLIDFSDYFNNIDHGIAKQIIRNNFDDDGIIWLSELFIDAYAQYNRKKLNLPECEAEKGLGLGSEINQTIAVSYPNRMDHYIKEVLHIKGYGRYMDDSYLIHESKEYLEYCLGEIRKICADLKITISEKKTHIVKLSHGFCYLKTQFFITESGKIVRKPCHSAIVRQRRKLKKQKKLVDDGVMKIGDVRTSYVSFRGSMIHKNARRSLRALDGLYNRLFIEEWLREGGAIYEREDYGDSE